VNGVKYRLPVDGRPRVVLLIDGGSQEYLAAAAAAGRMPNYTRMLARGPSTKTSGSMGSAPLGTHALVTCQMPTLTNPNNVSLICGASAATTGICGNYFYYEDTGKEVMMNRPQDLRCKTVIQQMAEKIPEMQMTIVSE
jgi:phosphonoacetate hydrolase